MGVFYSAAKMYDYQGDKEKCRLYNTLAVVLPVLIHGLYDYIASVQEYDISMYFVAFIIVLFVVSLKVIKNVSQNDRYMIYDDQNDRFDQ